LIAKGTKGKTIKVQSTGGYQQKPEAQGLNLKYQRRTGKWGFRRCYQGVQVTKEKVTGKKFLVTIGAFANKKKKHVACKKKGGAEGDYLSWELTTWKREAQHWGTNSERAKKTEATVAREEDWGY